MSMIQTVFFKKTELPTKEQLEKTIQTLGSELGFNFKFLEDFKNFDDLKGMSCEINGVETGFEIYFDTAEDLSESFPELKDIINNFDYGVSFAWGADYAAGACIAVLSIALIDICNSVVFFEDSQMLYSKEILMEEIPVYLKKLKDN